MPAPANRLLFLCASLLIASCVVDGTVVGDPGAARAPVHDCVPFDAGPNLRDAGAPDAGAPDAGARDAGACAAPDPCLNLTCQGCCENGACHAGSLTRQCGRNGNACRGCAVGWFCLQGMCTFGSPGFIDLTVDEDIVITDFADLDGGAALTVTATLRNLGDQSAFNVAWAVVLSTNTTVNLITDDIVGMSTVPIDLGAFETRRVTMRVQGPLTHGGGVTPSMTAFVWVDATGANVESTTSNNIRGETFSTVPAACRAATCSGCCTSAGCTPASSMSAMACGRAGAACAVCPSGQGCDAGVCQ